MASTNEKENASENRTMGRKYIVPYALYRAEGFVSAKFAEKTGFTYDDLDIFFEALKNMFEHDRSASHGKMASRKLFVFKHDSELGNAPASALFDAVKAIRKDNTKPPRSFADYEISVDEQAIPSGVELQVLL